MLLVVGSSLRDLIGREARELQRSVHVALRNTAGGVQKSYVIAPGVADKSLNLTVWHARPDESAETGPSTTHSVNRES